MLPEPRNVGWNHVVGLILVAGGIGACFYAAAIFQARATTQNPYGEPSEFVVQLPYTFTRNPMYLGFTTMLIGVAFFFDSLVMLLGPAVFFSVMDRLVIPNEERTMESLFGQSYLDYKQRVRRWI
jgi:protein-S-isoprenylcysteine O-methyltransferase Ste14